MYKNYILWLKFCIDHLICCFANFCRLLELIHDALDTFV